MAHSQNCETTTQNIGYYYKIYFSTLGTATFDFKLPGQYDLGGLFVFDGKEISSDLQT
jgi:hypothetical protein